MITRNISVPRDFWETCMRRAGTRSLSAVIRVLLQQWLDGKIDVD